MLIEYRSSDGSRRPLAEAACCSVPEATRLDATRLARMGRLTRRFLDIGSQPRYVAPKFTAVLIGLGSPSRLSVHRGEIYMSWNIFQGTGGAWLFSAVGLCAAVASLWWGATLNNTRANNTMVGQAAASGGWVAPPPVTFAGANVGAIPDPASGNCWGAFVPTPRNITFVVTDVLGPPSNVELSTTFSPIHSWVGDVRATLIAPNGASHIVFGRTGATTSTDSGDRSDLAGPYVFKDSAVGVNWWTEALNRLDLEALSAGNYRTTTGGGVVGAGTNTLMTPAFSGVRNPIGTWTLRVEDGCSGDTGTISAATLTLEAALPIRRPFDFDGDGKTDIGIFRPNGPASEWWINRSGTGQTFALQFGASDRYNRPGRLHG